MTIIRRRSYIKQKRPKLPSGYRRLKKEARSGLQGELNDAIDHLHASVNAIAAKFKRSKAWVRTQLFGGGKSVRFVRRQLKIRLYDAYVHVRSKELNADREVGDKLDIHEIKRKISLERPSYKNRPRSDQESWLEEYKADKAAAAREPRVNRKGEQQDAASTLKRVSNELDTLRTRTGVRSVVIAVRPEVLFTMDPFVFCDKHTEDFFNLALKMPPEQVARLLELSTINGLTSLVAPPPKNAGDLRKELRMRIQALLDAAVQSRFPDGGAPHVQMNYDSYDYEIVKLHRVRLVGWTFNNGKLINPGKLPMDDARELYERLVQKKVYFEVVPETEEINVERTKRVPRSDINKKRKKKSRTADGDASAGKALAQRKTARKSKATVSSSSSSPSPSASEDEAD
ncbi:hypothetical protein AURDEDRAFT_166547 [Auricularia subglabra TFB-10046 SS5]|nr:hypothetical protein AURDEDRAFT_166547 [Auricularia subglabra TFB-10046 SS5]